MKKLFNRNPLSALACLIVGLWLALNPILKPQHNAISWDVFGYYLYLPSHFLYNDPGFEHMEWMEKINSTYENTTSFYQLVPGPDGKQLIKYSSGMAILYAPGFFIAHQLAPSLGYPADGFSKPYQHALVFTHLLVVFLGFIFLRKVLLHLYSDTISALVLILIAFGTNYILIGESPGMTHGPAFTLLALLLWQTIRWHQTPSIKLAASIGALIGFSALVRPSNLLFALIPLLWNVEGWSSFKTKITHVWNNQRKHLVVACLLAFIAGLPQLLYWKSMTGHWLYYSYDNPGEGLDFLTPYTLQVLFSFRKGWFLYTPLMLLAVVGFIALRKQYPKIFPAVFLFFILNLYVVSSWTCWWYAASFSQRALMDSYPLMAIPLAALLSNSFASNNWKKGLMIAAVAGCFMLNVFQAWQFDKGIIHPSRMTKKAWMAILGKTEPLADFEKLLLIDRDQNQPFNNIAEYHKTIELLESFEQEEGLAPDSAAQDGNFSFTLDSLHQFSPAIHIPYREITRKDHCWMMVSGWVYVTDTTIRIPLSLVATFNHKGKAYRWVSKDLDKQVSLIPGKWNKLEFDYLSPDIRNSKDELNVYFWLREQVPYPVKVDALHVVAYEHKD
jgi:hypothetical protein